MTSVTQTDTTNYRTKKDVERMLGISDVTMGKLIEANEFPNAIRLQRHIRIPTSDIDAFIKRRRVCPSES